MWLIHKVSVKNIERIDKLIARQGEFSRNDVKQLIKSGLVYCNSKLVDSPALKIDPHEDEVKIKGEPYSISMFTYIMLNKPKDVISSTEESGAETVIDLVPKNLYRKNLFPAGRLDKDSTGFVLLTDDGKFAHSILSPKNHVPKTYEVITSKNLSDEDIISIEKGLKVNQTLFLPAKIQFMEDVSNAYKYQIILNEGKYHQIKRMLARLGHDVLSLHRTKIGSLSLDTSLALGQCREISKDELLKITKK